MIAFLKEIECVTLYAEDLPLTRAFYQDVFGLKAIYEDKVSAVLKLGPLMINLLQISEAPALIAPAQVAPPDGGSRLLFTIKVENADRACAEIQQHGVKLLNGPIDRPWGRRTAAFADPAGNIWEIAQELPQK